MLEKYQSMPYNQYRKKPVVALKDTLQIFISNLDSTTFNTNTNILSAVLTAVLKEHIMAEIAIFSLFTKLVFKIVSHMLNRQTTQFFH